MVAKVSVFAWADILVDAKPKEIPMVQLVICARRKSGMSKEAFHEYWRGTHGPLVKSVPEFMRHVRKYVQHHTLAEPVHGG